MLVRMKTTMAGPQGTAAAGKVVDVDKVTAKELINGNYAEPYETATAGGREVRGKPGRSAAPPVEPDPPPADDPPPDDPPPPADDPPPPPEE